jgi:hypothetical protein
LSIVALPPLSYKVQPSRSPDSKPPLLAISPSAGIPLPPVPPPVVLSKSFKSSK